MLQKVTINDDAQVSQFNRDQGTFSLQAVVASDPAQFVFIDRLPSKWYI